MEKADETCGNCGSKREAHFWIRGSSSDGGVVDVQICPTAIFTQDQPGRSVVETLRLLRALATREEIKISVEDSVKRVGGTGDG